MRKATILIALGALFGTLLVTTPAESVPETTQAPAVVQADEQNWKMGARPASSTVCLANGVAGYPMAYLLSFLTNASSGLKLQVTNRCDGYSVTNRFTITTYVASGTSCSKYTQATQTYDAVQGKYIFNANPVIWANVSDYCMPNDTAKAHRFALFVEYILGLTPETYQCKGTIGSTVACINQVKYPQSYDRLGLNQVYGVSV